VIKLYGVRSIVLRFCLHETCKRLPSNHGGSRRSSRCYLTFWQMRDHKTPDVCLRLSQCAAASCTRPVVQHGCLQRAAPAWGWAGWLAAVILDLSPWQGFGINGFADHVAWVRTSVSWSCFRAEQVALYGTSVKTVDTSAFEVGRNRYKGSLRRTGFDETGCFNGGTMWVCVRQRSQAFSMNVFSAKHRRLPKTQKPIGSHRVVRVLLKKAATPVGQGQR